MMDTNDDMILDMDNFDFMSLEDISEDTPTPAPTPAPEEVPEDEDDLDFLPSEEDEEDEEPSDEEDDPAEDEEGVDEEDEDTPEDDDTDEDDSDEEVDYESYELTLPTGETVVLADMVAGYKAAEALKAEREEFETVKTEFEEKSKDIGKYLALAKLEAEKVIEDYEDFDWDGLAEDNFEEYTQNRQFLDRYARRHKEITKAMEDLESKKAAEEDRVRTEQAREAAAVLARDIPGWGADLYRKLMDYAVENGADPDYIKACTDPATFKVLHKAMEFEKGKQKITAKVKRLGGSPKKVAKAAPKAPTQTVNPKKVAVLKKIEQTGDMSDAFDFLED